MATVYVFIPPGASLDKNKHQKRAQESKKQRTAKSSIPKCSILRKEHNILSPRGPVMFKTC